MASEKRKDLKSVAFLALSVAVGVTASSVPTFLRAKKPAPEPIQCIPSPSERPAVKGDGFCDIDKGEHDPLSSTFDPESCGECGDGQQQSWETKEFCPFDFHCGDKELNRSAKYAIITTNPTSGNFVNAVVEINEICDPRSNSYCKADCDLLSPNGNHKNGKETGIKKKSLSLTCSSDQYDINSAESIGAMMGEIRNVTRYVSRSFSSKRKMYRDMLDVDGNAEVTAEVTFFIRNEGDVSVTSVSWTCDGVPCKYSPGPQQIGSAELSRFHVDSPFGDCTYVASFSIPKYALPSDQ